MTETRTRPPVAPAAPSLAWTLLLACAIVACDARPAQTPSDAQATEADTDTSPAAAEPDHATADSSSSETGVSDGPELPWIDTRGTSLVGFGLLRLVPPPGGATFRLHYEEEANSYSTADDLQLFVLPFDAFATREMTYADQFLAFTRTDPDARRPAPETSGKPGYGDAYSARLSCELSLTVAEETVVIVAYGPWTGPDTGRPADDAPVFALGVDSENPRAAHAWIESEAGELITTNWTNRPGIARGGPCHDPITDADIWVEVRPLILYDGRLARAAGEPVEGDLGDAPEVEALLAEAERLEADGRDDLALDRRERAADLRATARRQDDRLELTPTLAERFRRVPIRWR